MDKWLTRVLILAILIIPLGFIFLSITERKKENPSNIPDVIPSTEPSPENAYTSLDQ